MEAELASEVHSKAVFDYETEQFSNPISALYEVVVDFLVGGARPPLISYALLEFYAVSNATGFLLDMADVTKNFDFFSQGRPLVPGSPA